MDDQRDGWDDLPVDPDLALGPSTAELRPSTRIDPRVLAAIAIGAMPGAAARYGISRLITVGAGTFPWATFWTNLSGSFAIGVLLVLLVERFPPSRHARAFAATGFLGAYTTFSTFSVETDVLIKDGHGFLAAAYVGASLAGGLAVVWLGVTVGRLIPHERLARRPRP